MSSESQAAAAPSERYTGIQDPQSEQPDPERSEVKRQARYPTLGQRPGASGLLMKRLQKGQQKFFDSGDYHMAKAGTTPPPAGQDGRMVTGEHFPTPQDLPPRKPSLVTSKLAT